MRSDDFASYTRAVLKNLPLLPPAVRKTVRVSMNVTRGAEPFNNMECGTILSYCSNDTALPNLALFLIALNPPKGNSFAICIPCTRTNYVPRSDEPIAGRLLVPDARNAKIVMIPLLPTVRRVATYCPCVAGCTTLSDGRIELCYPTRRDGYPTRCA